MFSRYHPLFPQTSKGPLSSALIRTVDLTVPLTSEMEHEVGAKKFDMVMGCPESRNIPTFSKTVGSNFLPLNAMVSEP